MGIFGRMLGGYAGYRIGGPLGSIAGVAVGHLLTRNTKQRRTRSIIAKGSENTNQAEIHNEVKLALAFITLAVKLSQADGRVSLDEIAALKQVVPIPASAVSEIEAIIDAAKTDTADYSVYTKHVVEIVSGDKAMLEQVFAGLIKVAAADGTYYAREQNFITSVAKDFRISAKQKSRIERTYIEASGVIDPYEVLGVSRKANSTEIHDAYSAIERDYDVQRLESLGLPEEFRQIAVQKTTAARQALSMIKKERRFK